MVFNTKCMVFNGASGHL